ncbi:MAG: EAL domain-containing protein [Desulfovibrionales bacterium]|nr:MAG: EAL domain-containing protein [Desulfovibrionales bacterium]
MSDTRPFPLQNRTRAMTLSTTVPTSNQTTVSLYEQIFESLGAAVLVADMDNRVILANKQAASLTGYSLKTLFNLTCWTDLIIPSQQSRILNWVAENHLHGSFPRHFEAVLQKHNNHDLHVHVSLAGVPDDKLLICLHDVSEIKKSEQLLYHKAFHDHLTGLPNRALFMEVLSMAIRRARRNRDYLFSVLYLDIDRFKEVNDSMGHLVGDQILIRFAEITKQCLRDSDMVTRMGGDEFAVILDDINDLDYAHSVARRLFALLEKPMTIGDRRVSIGVSLGIVADCRRYENPEEIIRHADAAMYGAKNSGRACAKVFQPMMLQQYGQPQVLEQEMRTALEQREFILYYQPIVSLATGGLHGFEALIRWERPGVGLIPPVEFIPAAEQSGLLHDLGRWILRQACEQMKTWQDTYPSLEDCFVCVNLSGCQCQDMTLEQYISQTLQSVGLPARNLHLEVTECKDLLQSQAVLDVLTRLRELGIKIHVDNFGTGASSLYFLHRFPIDVIKVDRSFVDRLDGVNHRQDQRIVESIISLAHSLDMAVVAEGVERETQENILTGLNCQFAQGYLYYRPMPPELINAEFLERITLGTTS